MQFATTNKILMLGYVMVFLRRLGGVACLSISLMFISASAQALLITDTVDPSDVEFGNGSAADTYSFTHDIDDGLGETGDTPFNAATDTITAVTIDLYFYDDGDTGTVESVTYTFDTTLNDTVNITDASTVSIPFILTVSSPSLLALVTGDGMLDVVLDRNGNPGQNDFWFDKSVFEVTFTRTINVPPIGIPEPASMGLFGIGLAGLGVISRRRKKKADVS